MGIFATLRRSDDDGDWEVTLYSEGAEAPFAQVEGSWEYVLRGLAAAGLAPAPVGGLLEERGRRESAFVRREPADLDTERLRQANQGSGFYPRARFPFKP